eukprot:CAMPEP_0201590444 /NCGR_PEP_ID=MMETSP0190_2-20130828/177806_1 /ASSEMBLY_ACC=CAM_ASM_000263 /TAXON_ID=37353 /ORGANISM="Rosalina sp." /LENGTH=137 /DNA_ID=CAMNT_0048046605 /DNA_START=192 /DNA_END=605 /DNA_ORIENTATION=+
MHAQESNLSPDDNSNIETNIDSNEINNNDDGDTPIENDVGSSGENDDVEEIEKKGGEHMVEIIVTLMLTMNILFMIYCCVKENKKAKKVSKYHVVSSDEFQFDTVDVNDLQNNKNNNIEDIEIGGANDEIHIDDDNK